ncbi:MAG TPA: hypothetical protein VF428_04385 [Casimicrobiaceae bacterium]
MKIKLPEQKITAPVLIQTRARRNVRKRYAMQVRTREMRATEVAMPHCESLLRAMDRTPERVRRCVEVNGRRVLKRYNPAYRIDTD